MCSFHRLNVSWTRGFDFVTLGFELVTCEFELVTCEFELVTRKVDLVTVHSTSGKCSLYFVYIFRTGWNFLLKFCSSHPSFSRNILRSLYLNFKTSAYTHIAISYYYALFTNFLIWYELNSHCYILINEVGQWFYQLHHLTFLKIYSNL